MGNEIDEREWRVLKRIVALLFAFADLAERIASRSRPVRALAVWILRPAEATARSFILEALADAFTSQSAPILPGPRIAGLDGDSAGNALRLAQSFRVLAQALDDWCSRIAVRWDGRGIEIWRDAHLHRYDVGLRRSLIAGAIRMPVRWTSDDPEPGKGVPPDTS